MKVAKLDVVGGNKIEWLLDGKRVVFDVPNVLQAEMDSKRKLIFVLSQATDAVSSELMLISADGKIVDACIPPKGFSFSYLTSHPSLGVAIVASSTEKVDGWYDWHFGYDKEKSGLYRFCPAY